MPEITSRLSTALADSYDKTLTRKKAGHLTIHSESDNTVGQDE